MPVTPLRYPGGKQKLAPFVSELLSENSLQGCKYVEPFAGGAGVALELLASGQVSEIHLNDSCPAIYAFWKSVRDEPCRFRRKVLTIDLSVREWKKQKAIYASPHSVEKFDLGFSCFYLNRCNRSGILGAGPIGGFGQTGEWKIDARFSRTELARRISLIESLADRIHLRCWDAEKFLRSYVARMAGDVFVYLDPPYFRKADRLYANHYVHDDHRRLYKLIRTLKHDWIVSYDHTEEISAIFSGERSMVYALQYNAGSVRKGTEVFYFSPTIRVPKKSSVRFIDASINSLC